MTKRFIIKAAAWTALLLVVMLGGARVWSVFVNEEPHLFSDSECFMCHFTLPQEGDPFPPTFTDEITTLCTECHGVSPLSHVVDVVPNIQVPEYMPLSETGTLTCATCHDPHMRSVNPVTGKKTYFLRTGRIGKAFCLVCHEDPNFPGEVSIFSFSGRVTHRRSMDKSHGVAGLTVLDPSSELDPLSVMCIGCHDESESEADHSLPAMGIWDHGGGIGRSHPIGVNYYDAAWKNKELVPIRDLDKHIVLFDDRIGCCTCHDMYMVGGGAELAIGSEDNYLDLCLACHIK